MAKGIKYSIEESYEEITVEIDFGKHRRYSVLNEDTVKQMRDLPFEVLAELLELDIEQVIRTHKQMIADKCKAVAELIANDYVHAETNEPMVFDDYLADEIQPGFNAADVHKGLKKKTLNLAQLQAIEDFYNNPAKVRKVGENA